MLYYQRLHQQVTEQRWQILFFEVKVAFKALFKGCNCLLQPLLLISYGIN